VSKSKTVEQLACCFSEACCFSALLIPVIGTLL